MDGWTDRPTHPLIEMHLIMVRDGFWTDGRMDQPTDTPAYRDARTHLIMVRGGFCVCGSE